jgi:hypothetical protein
MTNNNHKVARVAWLVSLLFGIGIFLPSLLGMDGMNGGYALAVLSGFVCMAAVITALMHGALARQQERLFAGDQVLVHWTYSHDEWQAFFREEAVRDRDEKKILFYIISAWAIIFGIGFPLYDRENGIYVTYVMLGLIVIIGITAYLSIAATRHQLQKHGGEAYISRCGAYTGGRMHSWSLVQSSLLGVRFAAGAKIPYIQIDYMGGKTEYTVRVPVPAGKEAEANNVVRELEKRMESA